MNVDTVEPVKKRRPRFISEMDKRSLEKLDRRSVEFKRYEEVRAALVSDLGGDDGVSTAQMQIADKCAFIAMQLERQQIASLAGEDIDMRAYGELVDRLRRNLETLGLERKLKDITSLSDTPLNMTDIARRIAFVLQQGLKRKSEG